MKRAKLRPARIWLAVFALWLVLISGSLSGLLGTPGVVQALRLQSLLDAKQLEVLQLEAEIQSLESEHARLEKNPTAQEREIRRVLGYAAPDEIIFDFHVGDRTLAGAR